jgi:uncharacterized protein (DUF58 family)
MPSPAQQLLSDELMTRLDRLDVLSRKILSGKLAGERRSKKKGQSVEFADYRVYVPGDDLRFIDWNLYARLEKLFLRLFVEEEDLALWVLLDVSASMGYGEPDKMLYAKQVAAALGYIGLVNYNRVSLATFRGGVAEQMANMRGRRPIRPMLEFLARQQAGGAGDLMAACQAFARSQRGKGVVVIISDLLDKGDYARALRCFSPDRFDLYAIQVLCPQEIDPEKGGVIGDLRLRDVEDGNLAEVSIGPALLARYKANLQAYCQHLRAQSVRRGVAHLVSDTSVPFEQLVLRYLRERGLLG